MLHSVLEICVSEVHTLKMHDVPVYRSAGHICSRRNAVRNPAELLVATMRENSSLISIECIHATYIQIRDMNQTDSIAAASLQQTIKISVTRANKSKFR